MDERIEKAIKEKRSIQIGEFVLLSQEDLDRINNAPPPKIPTREELDREWERLRKIWDKNLENEKENKNE